MKSGIRIYFQCCAVYDGEEKASGRIHSILPVPKGACKKEGKECFILEESDKKKVTILNWKSVGLE